ncbi:MAG: glycoside hydrolase family 9 protein [Bacteroidales bacterium]
MKNIIFLILVSMSLHSHAQENRGTYIVVDQFGYVPESEKIAIIRCPEIGFDADKNYTPGEYFVLINAETQEKVLSDKISAWKKGAIDSTSGDKVWYFDFSEITTPGSYYIKDTETNHKSYTFSISKDVYKNALKHAFRTFFYQRSGFPKKAEYAGEGWADEASHMGKGQDTECRNFLDKDNPKTEKDVHGGWYDAGDYNKYTNWTADYINYLLLAYEEHPEAWTDDFNIPESGNGIPDILDEVRFGLEHLLRLQFEDGSLIAVVGVDNHGSPPSSATGPSYWGGPSTSATLSGATSYAYGARLFKKYDKTFAQELEKAAIKAWDWAEKNPSVLFYNNSAEHGTQGLAAGQQEVEDLERTEKKLHAAMRLFILTKEKKYHSFFKNNYTQARMIAWELVFPFGEANQDMLLYYSSLPEADKAIAKHISSIYKKGVDTIYNLHAIQNEEDAFLAYQKDYVWGSNGTKAKQGSIYHNLITYGITPDTRINTSLYNVAGRYIHYFHGVNPLNMCYLTNMNSYGAKHSVSQLYHEWFKHGSEKWDQAGVSEYGPAPGFVVGGANPAYSWDKCCPDDCDSEENNAKCFEVDVSVITNQPTLKSYMDFNHGWPLNSWAISENSGGYQVQYLRLLSKFVGE